MKRIKHSLRAFSEAVRGTSKKPVTKVGMLTGKVSELGGNSINRLNRLTRTWRMVIIGFTLFAFSEVVNSGGRVISDTIFNSTFGAIKLHADNGGVVWFWDGAFWESGAHVWNVPIAGMFETRDSEVWASLNVVSILGLYVTALFGVLSLKGSHPTKRLVDTFLTDYFITEIKEGRVPDKITAEITVKEKIKETKFWKEITLREDGKKKGMKGLFFHDGYIVNEINIQYENVFAIAMNKHYGTKITEENKEVVEHAKDN